ncbi:hypothetical protein Trydic_g16655 [Trypoxylus dichotomus]
MALSTQAGDSSGNPPLRKNKPSGAERRKRKAAREAAMAQLGIKATREARTANPSSQKQHKAVREASKAKSSTSQKHEKATREAPEAQPGTNHSKATGVSEILGHSRIFGWPLCRNVGGPEPKFSDDRHRAGMLSAACVDAGTCSWLADVVRNCAPWDGAKLKLVREDDLPKPIKALVWIPGPQMESDQILHRLKVQNQKLPMSSWRVASTKDTYHGRLHLQFSSVSFRLLGRKTKEQTEAQERMDTIVAGPSNLSTPEPGRSDGTGSAVDSPRSIGTAHTITDLLESQMVDLLRTPPSEGSDSAGQEFNKNIDIVLIQEPWIIKGKVCGLTIGGWALVHGLDPNPRSCLLRPDIQWTHNSETRNLLLGSAYLPYDQEGPPPTSEVKTLMSYSEAHKLQFLLGCDANAHHTIWGSTDTNKRGESLISHFVTNGLVTLNRGNKPTFVTVSRAEVIDVTVCTPRFARWVKQWHVSDEPSLSDHRYIRFDIELPQVNKMYRNPSNCNWDAYRERLIEELERCPRRFKTTVDIELSSEGLQTEEQVLQHLLEVHFPGSEIIQTQFGGECRGLSPQIPDSRARRPFKSAGMDGIFPALLQQGQDLLSPVLCTLLKATLAVGHLLSSWREARVVFIPKQGKTSYTEAKSYRPISLTSFLLKTLEKIIDSI